MKPTSISGDRGLIGWGHWGSHGKTNCLKLNGGSVLRNYWWNNDLGTGSITSLADGQWHQVTATYDGVTRRIIVDGASVATDTPTIPADRDSFVNTANFCVGSCNNGEYFAGQMRNIRVFGKP